MICSECQSWITPRIDREEERFACPECAFSWRRPMRPLYIVTGPSGAGKTAIVLELQRLLPDWEVFETDILWDSGGDWKTVKCNWLRIADSLNQRPHPRPTILCGTILPEDLTDCDCAPYFDVIHWLALLCDAETLTARLRARPAWRGCDDAFIERHQAFAQWLREHTETFQPPLTLLDTSAETVAETALCISQWATAIQNDALMHCADQESKSCLS